MLPSGFFFMSIEESRIISGKGLVRIDKESLDFAETKFLFVYCRVIRFPLTNYMSANYNPRESRYATLNFMRDGFVMDTKEMRFPSQVFDFAPEPYQDIYALQCAYSGVLESFVNLATYLGATWISVENEIKDYRHYDLLFDEIKVVCYADTAIQVVVKSAPFELCAEQFGNVIPVLPPLPPAAPLPVSPGQPLVEDAAPSPAYDGDTDGGDSVPYPLDVPEEPQPEGGSCVQYLLQVSYTQAGTGQRQNNGGIRIYGEYIPQVRISPSSPNIVEFNCRGTIFSGCQPSLGWYGVADAGSGGQALDPAIDYINPV